MDLKELSKEMEKFEGNILGNIDAIDNPFMDKGRWPDNLTNLRNKSTNLYENRYNLFRYGYDKMVELKEGILSGKLSKYEAIELYEDAYINPMYGVEISSLGALMLNNDGSVEWIHTGGRVGIGVKEEAVAGERIGISNRVYRFVNAINATAESGEHLFRAAEIATLDLYLLSSTDSELYKDRGSDTVTPAEHLAEGLLRVYQNKSPLDAIQIESQSLSNWKWMDYKFWDEVSEARQLDMERAIKYIGYDKANPLMRALPYNSVVGYALDMDKYEYSATYYDLMIEIARVKIAEMKSGKYLADEQKNTVAKHHEYMDSISGSVDRAQQVLQSIEPGLNKDMYRKRVLNEVGLEENYQELLNQGIEDIKSTFSRNVNAKISDLLGTEYDCSTSEAFRAAAEDFAEHLVPIREGIKYAKSEGIDLELGRNDNFSALKERKADFIETSSSKSPFFIKSMYGMTDVCSPGGR
jgi:hypothetical protein